MSHIASQCAPTFHESDVASSVVAGLSSTRKTLPCSLFYDARGSELFEQITHLPEYYPTRTEAAILAAAARQIAARTAPGSVLVEFGSGSSRKTEILLDVLQSLAAYIPIDVSKSALSAARARLAHRYPLLRIIPTEGDFTKEVGLPRSFSGRPRLGFFPGSTIGNFAPAEASGVLRKMADALGPGARLLIGVDLLKDLDILIPAYNDLAGVTATFNLNLLVRINRELGADFDLAQFRHVALFNSSEGRIEMYLESLAAQQVRIGALSFNFAEGERIHTENSHKYTIPQFHDLAARGGWIAQDVWIDENNLFSLHELSVAE
ncbi:L-histidine N(alpha)-methyltransferase [Methylocapsa palsarum]|uniref:Dimethylhistidine N-methyltransferase n=1 Tax=Methylocapsa palsarum TaxID=1612308 RepID=A0A1I4BG12_9HYPH|nr:L-histidine N(alpha)-methyltransferase [Methylocapsa palsarum]SFK67097.1 dimethylhistidine N-methyltransferase [Methylocapsa palsarum]